MKSSLLLAPWEYVGDVPEVLCEGECSAEETRVCFELLWENGERRLVFRVGEDDGSWTIHPAPSAIIPTQAWCQLYATKHVEKALQAGTFARRFYLDYEGVQLFTNGAGFWATQGIRPYHCSFEAQQSLVGLTSSETLNWFLTVLDVPHSAASFARRFSQSTPSQKWQMVWGFNSEGALAQGQNHINHLCHLVLCSDFSLWQQESKIYWGLHAAHNSRPTRFWLRSRTSSKKLVNPYLQCWAPALEQFGPLRAQNHRLCIREFIETNPLLASGELGAPTFHEQLEARLELRDWGRQHLPAPIWSDLERLGE